MERSGNVFKTLQMASLCRKFYQRHFERIFSFLLKKHSSLTHPISSQLNRFIETGIYSRIYEKHLSKMKKARRSYKKVNDRKELEIEHLQTAFYALFLGNFISI
ncbi:hypothetical protein Avbf_12448, partial [Armadillidium vulgare]